MSDIEWTDTVWNPVLGCSRVSAGCQNCYAERFAHRGLTERHRGLTVMGSKGPRWTGEVRLVPEVLGTPLKWRKPRRVFVNSMSDLFHEGVPFEFIAAVFGVMAGAPQHTFQVLTKRPERVKAFFAWIAEQGEELLAAVNEDPPSGSPCPLACWAFIGPAYTPERDVLAPGLPAFRAASKAPWPLPNIWLGVSVEDQATANERIPLLLECPAAVRWVSYEPALGPVDFEGLSLDDGSGLSAFRTGDLADEDGLDWVVVGGESGPGARPFDLTWARSVVAQCKSAEVPCFVKQLGAVPYDSHGRTPAERLELFALSNRKGGDMAEWPDDLRVRQWPGGAHG